MKVRLLALVLLLGSLTLTSSLATQAQMPEPATPAVVASSENQPVVNDALGAPGLSFRYVQTFGETGVAYPEDTNHLNYPWGITTQGDTLWVAESWGLRLLNYSNTGTFIRSIGKAGSHFWGDTPVFYLTDVAVDVNENLWVAGDHERLLKLDAQGNVLAKFDGTGATDDKFNNTVSVAIDGAGNVYVSDGVHWWTTDVGHHRIVIFDANGNYLASIGDRDTPGSGPNQLHGPRHVTVYENLLYVADSGNQRVQIFDISNPQMPIYAATIGITGVAQSDNQHLNHPSGVAVDANFIYIADTYNARVQIFQRNSYAYVATIGGSLGSDNEQFWEPSDVAVDSAGNIYIADFVNSRVQQYDANRNYVRTFGVTNRAYVTDGNHFNRPFGVVVDNEQSIYIAEERGHRVVKLNAAGVFQWSAGVAGLKNDWEYADGQFSDAVDVTVGANGLVYVADRYGSRVQIFNATDGTLAGILYGNQDVNLSWVAGLDVGPDGHLYVANDEQHVVYVFDSNLNHIATLGVKGVRGNDDSHLNDPWDVAVAPSGEIYVVERANHRVKKCTLTGASGTCTPFVGEAGVGHNDFNHFGAPHRIAVDGEGNVYVTHSWYQRVDVYDRNGNYRTSVGGTYGDHTGQFREARGVTVAANGDLYVTDIQNHRIQKYVRGVPGWTQQNINGFGHPQTIGVTALGEYQGYLYAGLDDRSGQSRRLLRSANGKDWEVVIGQDFGSQYNHGIRHLMEFKEHFYASTINWNWNTNHSEGGEIWRSQDGLTWSAVATGGFGDPDQWFVQRLAVFNDQIFAGTWSYTTTHGAEIWRSNTGDSGSWERVVENGLGAPRSSSVMTFEVFDGYLYAAVFNRVEGSEIWRTGDGANWTKVMTGGFVAGGVKDVFSLASFGNFLYAGISNYRNQSTPGSELWRCQLCDGNDWQQVTVTNGFGNIDNFAIESLLVVSDTLYAVTGNEQTGLEVWRSQNGMDWQQVAAGGFGNSNNYYPVYDNSTVDWNGSLYVGTWNDATGGEIWQMLNNQVYLPVLVR